MTSRSGTKSTTSTMDMEKISIAQAVLDALNMHDLSKGDRSLADDYSAEVPGMPGMLNKIQSREYNQRFLTAFPDLHFDIQRSIVQDDYVVQHWTAAGTHTGPLVGPDGRTLSPTNRRARVSGVTINEIKQGKVMRAWVYWDMTGLLAQLGGMPPI